MSSQDRFTSHHQRSLAERLTSLPDSQPDPTFDRLTRLASRLVDASASVLVIERGDEFQVVSAAGIAEFAPPGNMINGDDAICRHIVQSGESLVIPDTGDSPFGRFSELIARAGLKAFLGVPIRVYGNITIGFLGVGCTTPQGWTNADANVLDDIADLAAHELERRQPDSADNPEEALIDQRRREKERLLESIGEGVYATDKRGVCHFINRAGANMLGYEPAEVIGQQMHELVHYQYPDGSPMPREECTIDQAMQTGEARSVTEHVFWRRDGSPIRVELTVSPVTESGEVTGTVVRFSDHSERRLQQERLRESEVRKSAMFEAALDCIITIDHEGRVVEFNSAAERTFGYSREFAVGRLAADLIMPAEHRDACLEAFRKHLDTGSSDVLGRRIERPAIRADGTRIETEMAVTRIDLPDQPYPLFTAYIRDISDRKQAERDLRVYKHVVDAVGQAVVANDNSPERRITYWNRAAEQIFGWKADEVLGRGLYDVIPPEDFKEKVSRIGQFVRQGRDWQGEFRVLHRDGHEVLTLATVNPIMDEDGELLGVVAAFTDLTEIKETEQEIRLYKHIVESVGESVVASDMDRRIMYANRAAEEALGWSIDDVRGKDIRDVIPAPAYREQSTWIGSEVRKRGKAVSGEFELQRTSGESFPALVTLAPISGDNGELVGTIGIYTDITELKETEREIRLYKHLTDAVGQALIANDFDRQITYINSAAEQMLGWRPDEIAGLDFYDVVPADEVRDQMPAIGDHVRQGNVWSGEFRLKRKDGSSFPVLMNVSPVFDEQGQIAQVIGAYTDISELKETEQQIRFYKHLADATGQALIADDLDRRITYWNKAAELMLGWSADEVLGLDFADVAIHEDELHRVPQISTYVRQGATWTSEFHLKHRSGHPVPVLMSVSPVFDEDGNIAQIIGAYTDITELRRRETEIRFFQHVVEALGEAVLATSLDGKVTYLNSAAEQMLGWREEEINGREFLSLIPDQSRLEEARHIAQYVREGKPWLSEFTLQRKDGSVFPAIISVAPVFNEQNEPSGIISAYTDISDLKSTEEDLRFHKHMLDAVGQAVCATDESLRVTYWNRAAEELYGYTAVEAIGTNLLDFLPIGSPTLQQAHQAIEVIAREGAWTGEMLTYHKDGTEIAALVSSSPILGEENRQVGLIVALADISARRKIEQALQESNEQITDILETMGDGFISLNRDWTVDYVNLQAERITGKHRDRLLGTNFWNEFPEPEHQPFYSKFAEAFETGTAVDVTDYDPGLGIWLEVHASPSGDKLSVFFRDVTERRKRESALREAEERYRTLIEQLPAMTYIAHPDDPGRLSYVSPQVKEMLGYSTNAWMDVPNFWIDLLHPDDRDHVIAQDALTVSEGRDRYVLEYRLRDARGNYHWLRDTATLIRDIDGSPSYWQGLSYDITDQKRAERTIRESEQRFRSLFENHPDAVFSIDRTGFVLSANPAFEQMTGFSFEDDGPIQFVDLVVPEDRQRVRDRFAETHHGEPQDFRSSVVHPRGNRIELSLTTIPIIVDEDIVGVHVVAQDVTIQEELENQLAHQAYHDSLTGLPNRNLFLNRLDERIEQARREKSQFAVLFFDLDDFKVINDSLGHSAGDQLLMEVARRVQTCIRAGDLLARLGGDEFTLLLERVEEDEDATFIAERIAKVLDEPFEIDNHEVFATTSIGIAIDDGSSPSADDVLRNADLAMYEAKNLGKNRYAIFEPSMNSRAWLRLTLETEIRRGIPRNEFDVHYQPIVDLESGELEGVEALVRWNHPERGFLTPRDFISVAEQSGLILPLGRWIIREATEQLRDWQRILPEGKSLRLSLNLSPREYQHPRLVEELTRTLQLVEFDPQLITLEITESIAMEDTPDTQQTLQQLKDVGVQLALDDFGTGFSALSYLRRFPIDIIKIDQSFVNGLGTDPEDTRIVQAVMAASLAMNLRVTAEGVETIDQLRMLRDLGCNLGQGYLFAQALSADDMHQMITQCRFPWHTIFRDVNASDEPFG